MSLFIELKKHFPARALEWFCGILLLSWGFYVLLHPGMFQGSSSLIFSGLDMIASQELWGLAAFSLGFLRLIALYINGQWTRTPLIRVCVSFASVFMWFWITVGLYKSGIDQTGLAIYPWLVVADMYSAFRAASDAYEAEAQRRLDRMSRESTSNVSSLYRS